MMMRMMTTTATSTHITITANRTKPTDMLFFNTKKTLIDTGILQGATDWHSHILPGVDDGISNMKDSLEVLRYYEQIGIQTVWLTPHIMEDIPNATDDLRDRFDDLCCAYDGPIQLHLAAENMLDNLFDARLAANDVLPIGPNGDHLLVETSYFQPPMNLYKTLKQIQEAGYQPILAHPERYVYMDESDYNYLAEHRVKLQLNLMSLAGGYGTVALEKAKSLLSKGYYSFWGSDLHRLAPFAEAIHFKGLKSDAVKRLQGIPNTVA